MQSSDVIVVGAGVAGLTAAALLAHAGASVTVLEAHNVPGGCASFYQKGGYRFDVGATLVSGFGPRGVHRALFARLGAEVVATPVEPSMVVHLPGLAVTRYGDDRWVCERQRAFGGAAEPFWHAMEAIADRAWDFSTRFPMLPTDLAGIAGVLRAFRPRHIPLVATLGRSVGDVLGPAASSRLRTFVDAQLLITAQADSAGTDLAYGATALDLAREGTFHLPEGVSGISVALARALRRSSGNIAYKTKVAALIVERGRVVGVRASDAAGEREFRARHTVAAIPVADVNALLSGRAHLARATQPLAQRWGAFLAYVGLPPGVVPDDAALHHQVVLDESRPLGEGNSAFLSFSGLGERGRARNGGRAVTVSTHTDVARWERAHATGQTAALRAEYARRLRAAFERVMPGAWDRADFVDLADPHTFERYTGRHRGLVGGLPQAPLAATLGAFSHASGVPGLVLAGDTVFPGQSTVGASLGGVAAARAVAARSTSLRVAL